MNRRNGDAARGAARRPRQGVSVTGRFAASWLLLLVSGRDVLASPQYPGRLAPLVYHGRPLTEVIEEVQRYVRRRIRVDAAAAEFQYSGIVKPEDIDAWLRDLPTIYPLEVVDCHVTGLGHEVSACVDPQLLLIRSRVSLQYSLRTASR